MLRNYPFEFDESGVLAHELAHEEYEVWKMVNALAICYLSTNSKGCIASERNFEKQLELNKEYFDLVLNTLADEGSPEEIWRMWSFLEAL